MAVNPDKPWRLEEVKLRHEGDKRPGAIGPVIVLERGGKFSVSLESHHLKLSRNDLCYHLAGPRVVRQKA